MNIREINRTDLDQLCDLFDAYRIFYRKQSDLQGAHVFLKDRLEKGDSKIFVGEVEGRRLVGFTQLYPLFSSTRMRRLWLLNDLFVDPEFRGMGISKKLIDRAKTLVKETSAMGLFLETEKTNRIGNELYPRAGFKLNQESNFYEWIAH